MKNLRITTRLAISIVFLMGALLFFAHAFIETKREELHALHNEIAGLEFLGQVTDAVESLSRYRLALLYIELGEAEEADAAQARSKVDAAFEVLRLGYATHAERFQLTSDALAIRHRSELDIGHIRHLWQQVAGEHFREEPQSAYNSLFNCLHRLSEYVVETSGLAADRDIATDALVNAILRHVSEALMRTMGAESMGYIYAVRGERAPEPIRLASWDYGTFMLRDNLRLVQTGMEAALYYDWLGDEELDRKHAITTEALQRYLNYGKNYAAIRIAMGEGSGIIEGNFREFGRELVNASYDLWRAGAGQLHHMLKLRASQAEQQMQQSIWFTVLSILLSLGFFIYVTRGIVHALCRVEKAMERVANGELELEVPHQDQRDEIGSIARTLERFRTSYWWLRD